jgi:hypothetical protein
LLNRVGSRLRRDATAGGDNGVRRGAAGNEQRDSAQNGGKRSAGIAFANDGVELADDGRPLLGLLQDRREPRIEAAADRRCTGRRRGNHERRNAGQRE